MSKTISHKIVLNHMGALLPIILVLFCLALLIMLEKILGPVIPELEKFSPELLQNFPFNIEATDRFEIVNTGLWWLFWTYVFWIIGIIVCVFCSGIYLSFLKSHTNAVRNTIFSITIFSLLLVILMIAKADTLAAGKDLLSILKTIANQSYLFIKSTNSLGVISLVLILVTSWIILLPQQNQNDFSSKSKYINILLYLGAILISSWIMQARLMYGFSATLLVTEQQQLVERLSPTISLIVGATASIYIGLMYIGSVLVILFQQRHINTIHNNEINNKTGNTVINPITTIAKQWPKLIAVIGPMLPGITEIFLGFST